MVAVGPIVGALGPNRSQFCPIDRSGFRQIATVRLDRKCCSCLVATVSASMDHDSVVAVEAKRSQLAHNGRSWTAMVPIEYKAVWYGSYRVPDMA